MNKGRFIRIFLKLPLAVPYIVCYFLTSQHDVVKKDLLRWAELRLPGKPANWWTFAQLVILNTNFRKQFCYRIGGIRHLLGLFLPAKLSDILEANHKIEGGLVIVHMDGVGINSAVSIGKNCTILQMVTIGWNKDGAPQIGDNVMIGAGAILVGNIRIGNNVKIGAGAIVVEDVPDDCTVVGPKAKIIQRNNI